MPICLGERGIDFWFVAIAVDHDSVEDRHKREVDGPRIGPFQSILIGLSGGGSISSGTTSKCPTALRGTAMESDRRLQAIGDNRYTTPIQHSAMAIRNLVARSETSSLARLAPGRGADSPTVTYGSQSSQSERNGRSGRCTARRQSRGHGGCSSQLVKFPRDASSCWLSQTLILLQLGPPSEEQFTARISRAHSGQVGRETFNTKVPWPPPRNHSSMILASA